MINFIFSNVAGYEAATLLKVKFISGVFKSFAYYFQNSHIYISEHLLVASSKAVFRSIFGLNSLSCVYLRLFKEWLQQNTYERVNNFYFFNILVSKFLRFLLLMYFIIFFSFHSKSVCGLN